MKSLYLISPRPLPQAYFGAEIYAQSGYDGVQFIGDLPITTVAALAPQDFHIRLCDENVSPADLTFDGDYVGLTGKSSQSARMVELADEYRRRGRVVIIGGPFASLDPETARQHCDILVRGEIEEIAPQFFSDLRSGQWKDEYVGTRPDLSLSPIPRWDLYPNDRTLAGAVQVSRGCPFECEFCDVPAYVGRKQRHKQPSQVLAELDVLYGLGYRSIFIADDNFTVYRRHAKETLSAIRWWCERREAGNVAFSTQVSLDAARDDELLRMCGEAGIVAVFIGIETPNQASLKETRKRQNVVADMAETIGRFLDHGIMVIGGMIVGFDADGPDIFDMQREFIAASRVPIFSLGALIAPEQTPLIARLRGENRLLQDAHQTTATPWSTNIVPKRMSRDALLSGLQTLGNDIYHPAAFGERVVQAMARLGPYFGTMGNGFNPMSPSRRKLAGETAEIIRRLYRSGEAEKAMVTRVTRHAMSCGANALSMANMALQFYAQVRCVYDMTGFSKGTAKPAVLQP